jgi:hypothetical protein
MRFGIAVLGAAGFVSLCLGQADISRIGGRVTAQTKPIFVRPQQLPMNLGSIVEAHGGRFQLPGKERLVMAGTLRRGNVSSALQIVNDLPGKLRLIEVGGRGKTITFDLEKLESNGGIDDVDEDLAEALAVDTIEQFFLQVQSSRNWRSLGQRFRVTGEAGFGAEVDVFEVTLVSNARRAKEVRTKLYMFDYRTGLLRRTADTVTRGARRIRSETVYSDYTQVDGSAVVGKIQRIVDGAETFVFTRQSASLSAAAQGN